MSILDDARRAGILTSIWASRARHFRELAEGLSSSFSANEKVSGGPMRNIMEEYAIAAAEAQKTADENAAAHLDLIRQADELIATIPDDNLRDVLTMRYVGGQNAEQISEALHISKRTYYRWHDKAVKALGETMN